MSGLWIKLIHTGLQISTKEAFAGIVPTKITSDLKSIHSKDRANFSKSFKNDFEQNCIARYPVLGEVKNQLLKEGAFYASMSGSGSAFFGLFEKEPALTGTFKHEFIIQL